jgi:hypothetical protein
MEPPSLPMIAYIFIGMSACVLTYVTYAEEINKIPNAIAETTSSVVNSTANSIKSATSSISSASITGSTIPIATQISNLMPTLPGTETKPVQAEAIPVAPAQKPAEPSAPVIGGSKKRRRSKKRKNTKKNKSSKK